MKKIVSATQHESKVFLSVDYPQFSLIIYIYVKHKMAKEKIQRKYNIHQEHQIVFMVVFKSVITISYLGIFLNDH